MTNRVLPISERRRRKQKGMEAIEFGLWAVLMMPPFVWMFINGINFVRYNKAGDVTRSAAMMYIKGVDMSGVNNQKIVARVANGLNLQVESGGTRVHNLGDGMVVMTQIQYIGATCGCTNANNYVMTRRMYLGNRSLSIGGQTAESFTGAPPAGSIWNSTTGSVSNFMTDANARVTGAFVTLWGNSLSNGQTVYVVESFFKTPAIGSGAFDSRGIYTRVFM
jgi:hypothetical protein